MSHKALLVVVLTAACGGPPKPPDPIGNTGDPPPVPEAPLTVTGVITDDLGQPAIGATIVLVGVALVGEQVVITNEQGQYKFDNIPPGPYELNLYYNDLSFKRAFSVDGPTTLNQAIRLNGAGSGEVLFCKDDRATSCN